MAWKSLTYRLNGSAPLIMHNGQTADPTNRWAKSMKQVSSKRVKTDADYEELAKLEFFAALYLDKELGPVIPAPNIEAMLIEAAKKSKEGMLAKSGLICTQHMALTFDGPRTIEDLWTSSGFRYTALVRIGTSRIARTRPIFDQWGGDICLQVEDSVVNPGRVDDWIRVAGQLVGLGDWRPQHGRFTAARLNG